MLFRTVYGPELKAIYAFVVQQTAESRPPLRRDIHQAFVPILHEGELANQQNVDDALSFLQTTGLIEITVTDELPRFYSVSEGNAPFRVQVLQAIRQLEIGERKGAHPTDALYLLLLTELFVRPNRLFLEDLHSEANQLRQVREAGGLSKEKTQTWKRVMEYLGIGRRVSGGFLCAYTPGLVTEIIDTWEATQGTLQAFLETHFGRVLPFQSDDGDLADCVAPAFEHLVEQGIIALFPMQDSPTKPYFGDKRWKGIERITDGQA